ncbi:sigma factor-like helix-turn-helix DNA-binding protein [Clostridium sp.]|uniref:sigma factor-like helix-turn-helix DNA-binding protein n=1 Tax=Clostridium sp. TaxID=1506 RepID=UPI0034640790
MLRNYKKSKNNRANYIYYSADGHAVDVNHREGRVIFIGKEAIPVTEEVYQTYYKGRRRERYMQSDVKVGRIDVDMENQKVTFVDSKEDSIERLYEQGADFKDEQSVEDIACDNAMLLILNKAKEILDEEELKLINAVYDQELTYRQAGEILNISHVAVQKRHNKILEKLRKYFL